MSGFHRGCSIVWVVALLTLCLVVEVVSEAGAEAQGFGAGRSRDSIFNRRRSGGSGGGRSRDDGGGQAPAPAYQAPQQPAPQEEEPVQPPAPPPLQVPVAPAQPVPGQQVPGIVAPQPGKPVPPGKRRPGQPGAPGQQPPPQAQGGIPPEGQIVLRLVPTDQKADVGQVFMVHVWLDNPEGKPFEAVSFALSYDPKMLEFVDAPGGFQDFPNSYDQSETIKAGVPLVRDLSVDPFYLNMADAANGLVFYRARTAQGENTKGQGFLASMKFKALEPVEHTGLRFVFSDWPVKLAPPVDSSQGWSWPATMTFVGGSPKESGDWRNLLGSDTSARDGVVSGAVTLKGDYTKAMEEEAGEAPKGETGTKILLQPPLTSVQAGKTFGLVVRLENPGGVPWDRIRLDIEHDPDYLEVVDEDEGNWISRGVNILDGPFRDRFPFEWMRNNLVRPKDGKILYECGVFRSPLRSSGNLAVIRLRALKPIPETRVVFRMPSEVTSPTGTILSRKRGDMLGDTEYAGDGVMGALVMIVPPKDFGTEEKTAKKTDR
jgi:hypothetical protein